MLGERRLTLDLVDATEPVADPDVRVIARYRGRGPARLRPPSRAGHGADLRLTARHAVRDLFVENPPIEEVIARLYEAESGGER